MAEWYSSQSKANLAAHIVSQETAIARAEAERDAARDAALEEAAKVADMHNYAIQSSTAADLRAAQIAAVIRALKGKSHE